MKPTGNKQTKWTVLGAVLLAAGLAAARGQTAATTTTNAAAAKAAPASEVAKPSPWETSASAGLTLTRGNTHTLLMTLGLDTKRKWEQNDASLGLNGGYGSDNGVNNSKYVNGYGQFNHSFSDRFYAGLRLDGSYDGVARLDHRLALSPLAGYYVIKDPRTTLSFELGPSAVTEKHEGQSEQTYLGFRAGERFEHKLSATTKIWEALSYVPRVDEWDKKYVITFEAGIDATISKHWSLRVVLQDIYDSEPTAGRMKNDMRLVAGTAYKF